MYKYFSYVKFNRSFLVAFYKTSLKFFKSGEGWGHLGVTITISKGVISHYGGSWTFIVAFHSTRLSYVTNHIHQVQPKNWWVPKWRRLTHRSEKRRLLHVVYHYDSIKEWWTKGRVMYVGAYMSEKSMNANHCKGDAEKQPVQLGPKQDMTGAAGNVFGQFVDPVARPSPHAATGLHGWTHWKLLLEDRSPFH